ncbi:MAG: Zn-ribbon containing protein [Planctomycetota bacterium]
MSAPRVVRNFHIQSKTGLFGKSSRKASFECPHCKARLVSGEDEIGKSDVCPSCGGEFVLAKEAAEKIRRLNEEDKAEAERQASAEEQQQEVAAATKRREQAAAAARRTEKEKDNADARRQQNAELQLVDAKASFRNYDIRQYPMLELLADIFRVLMWCAILLTVLWDLTTLAFVVFDFNDMRRYWWMAIVTSVLWALPTAIVAFLLKLVSELIRLFINVAQDNERLVRLSEAAIGKPWAPK